MPDTITIRLSQPLRAALDEHCAQAGQPIADTLRTAIATHVGRPDLAQPARRGRPPKLPVNPLQYVYSTGMDHPSGNSLSAGHSD